MFHMVKVYSKYQFRLKSKNIDIYINRKIFIVIVIMINELNANINSGYDIKNKKYIYTVYVIFRMHPFYLSFLFSPQDWFL